MVNFFLRAAQLALQRGYLALRILEVGLGLLKPSRARRSLELGFHQSVLGLQVYIAVADMAKVALRLDHLLLQALDHLESAALRR